MRKYFKIFTTCMFLSTFTFGGGYVIIPLMRRKFVNDLKWLEEAEMLDLTSIAQSSPGSIAVNAAILLGYKVAGFLGALVALLGTVLPSVIIVILVSIFYSFIQDNVVARAILKGMQAGVAALIIDISLTLSSGVVKEKNILFTLLMAVSFILIFFLNVNVGYIVLACILIGIISFLRRKNKQGSDDLKSENEKNADESMTICDMGICAETDTSESLRAEDNAESNNGNELDTSNPLEETINSQNLDKGEK